MRRVMVIAYQFPPLAGVGIERTLKFVTYLPEAGWQPAVVAPANSGYRLIDPATLERVPPGTEVHRALTLEPAHLRRAARRVLAGAGSADRPAGAAPTSPGSPSPRAWRRVLNEAWRRYVELAFFPDEQLGWAPDAIRTALAAHGADPVEAIYSSAPPVTGHLVATVVQRVTGLPWIADFRDPWIGNAYAAPPLAPQRAIRAELERMMVEAAARSVFVSAGIRDEYADRYPALANRFAVIPNGYDRSDVPAAAAAGTSRGGDEGRFRLILTGSMQGIAEFELFADAMELLLARDPELPARFVVQFVGWFSPAVETVARERLPRFGAMVERLGFRPKSEALALLRGADAALVLVAAGPGRQHIASGKIFDYLGADAQVLAVAPDGEVRRILRELDWGIGVDPTPEAFADGILALLRSRVPDRPADPQGRYERRSLTGRLAVLLNEVTETSNRRDPR